MKRLALVTLIVLFIFAVIVLAVWLAGRNVYVIEQPITASPEDCGDGLRVAVVGD